VGVAISYIFYYRWTYKKLCDSFGLKQKNQQKKQILITFLPILFTFSLKSTQIGIFHYNR